MENFYTAYTKSIDGVTFHFVKHFQIFPEYKNLPPVLENYGMHTDFYKACKIAMIEDITIQEQLLVSINGINHGTEVIHVKNGEFSTYNYENRQMNLPGLLSWIGLRKLLHFK